jgi:hypothetical protein
MTINWEISRRILGIQMMKPNHAMGLFWIFQYLTRGSCCVTFGDFLQLTSDDGLLPPSPALLAIHSSKRVCTPHQLTESKKFQVKDDPSIETRKAVV